MKVSELLATPEQVSALLDGVNPEFEVRIAIQPGAVDVVAEPAPVEAAPEEAPEEQKEGE